MLALCLALAAGSCKKDNFEYPYGGKTGTLSLGGLSLSVSEEMNQVSTKASAAAGNYTVLLYDNAETLLWKKSYSEVLSGGDITLNAGNYTLVARSTSDEAPQSAFDVPVYGVTQSFTIKAGETTSLGTLTCTLLQAAVSVGYNDDFLKSVTGAGSTTVELAAGYPLEYALTYSGGKTSYESRIGYFAVSGVSSTIILTFKGSIDGKSQKMKTSITGVKARDYHVVTILKKVDASGNASFSVEIDGLVEDMELETAVEAVEQGDGIDPNAPSGDGGITLVSTCSYDISEAVTVPSSGPFPLTMQACVPNGVRKFTVDIASTNADFINSVNTVGGTTLDLINPSDAALGVFSIVPFPHGSDLSGKTLIDFDLADAQTPLLAFPGTHTFTMNVTDNKGCRKSIAISLVVL